MAKTSRQEVMDAIADRKVLMDAKTHPEIAKQFLESVCRKLIRNIPLSIDSRLYLAEAIGKILNGLPADRALYLTRSSGRQLDTFSPAKVRIYYRVKELVETRKISYRKAYLRVADEEAKNARSGKRVIGEQAIEKIYQAIKKINPNP